MLLVLDGTTGLNMLPQAREFNQVPLFLSLSILFCSLFYDLMTVSERAVDRHLQWELDFCGSNDYAIYYLSTELSKQVVGVTGFILTKLDGTARGGCVVWSPLSSTTSQSICLKEVCSLSLIIVVKAKESLTQIS